MSVELTYPHIEKLGHDPAQLKRLRRVRVAQIVMDYLAHGWSPEEMCRQHPSLRLAEVHAAMGYYYDHQEEIDNEIRAEVEQAGQGRAAGARSPFFVRLRAKG